jgi:hypothetical protein
MHAARLSECPGLVEQARLSDPGGRLDKRDAAGPRNRACHCPIECRELGATLQQAAAAVRRGRIGPAAIAGSGRATIHARDAVAVRA